MMLKIEPKVCNLLIQPRIKVGHASPCHVLNAQGDLGEASQASGSVCFPLAFDVVLGVVEIIAVFDAIEAQLQLNNRLW